MVIYKDKEIYPSEINPLVIEKRTQWHLENSHYIDSSLTEHGINCVTAKLTIKVII